MDQLYSEKEHLEKYLDYNKAMELGIIPKMGMIFESEGEAYEHYNAYAMVAGFSIRKYNKYTRESDGKLQWREYCCSCQGMKEKHSSGTPKKSRPQKRFDCKAMIRFNWVDGSENFVVTKLVAVHTHELSPPDMTYMLRSHRCIRPAQKELINSMTDAGIGPSEIYHYCAQEYGGYNLLNFTHADLDNMVQRRRIKFLKEGDAAILLNYFRRKKEENSSFYYEIQLDSKNQICSCFWCDAKSRIDYECFGDSVSFDTTYKTNDYEMPFAPFVGVNHHRQTITFACALVSDETTETFVWIFEQFLLAMGRKVMKTIFTDQAPAIGNAIKQVFPDAHHRLCIWHIQQNALRNLSHIFSKYETFNDNFKRCIYGGEVEEDFLSNWANLLERYELEEEKWLQTLFQKKEKWAQVYGRQHFCAGMASTQRSESMNNYFKKYFKRKQIFGQFMTQFDKAMSLRRQKEKDADVKSFQTEPNLTSKWVVECLARAFYTRKMFSIFQEQLQSGLDLGTNNPPEEADDSQMVIYDVESLHSGRVRRVEFRPSDNTARCSCQMFEFTGMPCAHMLKVWRIKNVPNLPSEYFLTRWSKAANPNIIVGVDGNTMEVNSNVPLSERFSELSHMAQTLVTAGSLREELTEVAKKGLKRTIEEVETLRKTLEENVGDNADASREDPSLVVEKSGINQLPEHVTVLPPPRKKKSKGEPAGRIQGFYDKMKKNGARQRKSTTGKKAQDGPKEIERNTCRSTKNQSRKRGEDEENIDDVCEETTLVYSSIQNDGVIGDAQRSDSNSQVPFSYQQLLADQCATVGKKLTFSNHM